MTPLFVMLAGLNVISIAVLPCEADAILIVDSYAVLACPVTVQLFQPIARAGKVFQVARLIQHLQFSFCRACRPAFGGFSRLPKLRRGAVGKSFYHVSILTPRVNLSR